MICDVESSKSVNEAKKNHALNIKTYKNILRIYDESFNMELSKSHYYIGQHEIPLAFKLHEKGESLSHSVTKIISSSTFGDVAYSLKAYL